MTIYTVYRGAGIFTKSDKAAYKANRISFNEATGKYVFNERDMLNVKASSIMINDMHPLAAAIFCICLFVILFWYANQNEQIHYLYPYLSMIKKSLYYPFGNNYQFRANFTFNSSTGVSSVSSLPFHFTIN